MNCIMVPFSSEWSLFCSPDSLDKYLFGGVLDMIHNIFSLRTNKTSKPINYTKIRKNEVIKLTSVQQNPLIQSKVI